MNSNKYINFLEFVAFLPFLLFFFIYEDIHERIIKIPFIKRRRDKKMEEEKREYEEYISDVIMGSSTGEGYSGSSSDNKPQSVTEAKALKMTSAYMDRLKREIYAVETVYSGLKEEEKKVKLAAHSLYNTLIENKKDLFVVDWQNDSKPRAKVREKIISVLNEYLPDSYDRIIFQTKSDIIFEHIVEQATMGYNWSAA